MKPVQKFFFETSFDHVEDLGPGETVYTHAAHEKGYALGFADGHSKGVQEGHGDVLNAVQHLSHKLNELVAFHEEAKNDLHAGVVNTSYFMMKSLFPKYAEEFGKKEILHIVENALKEHEGETLIELIVSPSIEKPLSAFIEDLKKTGAYGGDILINSDPSLAVMDCKILWKEGGCERLVARIWEEIRLASSRIISMEILDESDQNKEKDNNNDKGSPQEVDNDI